MLKVQDSVGRQAKGARTRAEAQEMSQSNWHLCEKLQESLKSINKWPSRVLVALVAMHAFLMAQGLWGFTDGTNTEPYPPIDPIPIPPLAATASQAESNAHDVLEAQYKVDKAVYEKNLPLHPALFAVWQKGNDMALGNLTLCLSPAIQQCLSPNFNAEETWEWPMREFNSPSLPSVYCNLREAITLHINPAHHPGPQFDKLEAAFGCISNTTIRKGSSTKKIHVPEIIQALIMMAAIPSKWENLIPIICNSIEIQDLEVTDIKDIVVTQFENETNHGAHKGNKKEQHANKLSNIKQKCNNNPCFKKQSSSQQQATNSPPPNQQQHKQHGARVGARRGKAKGKGKASQAGHSHVASVTALTPTLPSPSTTSVTHIGPSSSIVKCTVSIPHPTLQARVEGPYPTVNHYARIQNLQNSRFKRVQGSEQTGTGAHHSSLLAIT
jgi:hypothetical protein